MKHIEKYYWFFIFVIQVYLLYEKIPKNEFYLWNIVAGGSSIFFLYNRIVHNKVLKNYESIIVLFLIFNSISTFVTQVLVPTSMLKLTMSLFVGVLSFCIAYKLNSKLHKD